MLIVLKTIPGRDDVELKNINSLKNDKMKTMILASKILVLFLCAIPLAEYFISGISQKQMFDQPISQSSIIVLIILFAFMVLWMFIKIPHNKLILVLSRDIIIFLNIVWSSVLLIGYVANYYKFVLILIIIINAVELSMTAGIFIAGVASAVIFGTDLILYGDPIKNIYLENDIVLGIMFVIVAGVLGFFTREENLSVTKALDYANIDGLTNVYSLSYFYQLLKQSCDESQRMQIPLSLLILDIDYFKFYNDLYGYSQGDVVLKEIAEILKSFFRQDRIICRYGGEKFAVILKDTDIEIAEVAANKLREFTSDYQFFGQEKLPNKNLTISVGVSQLRNDNDNYTSLVKRTESALNKGKYLRRNSVGVYSSIFEEFCQASKGNKAFSETLLSLKALVLVINSRDSYTFDHTQRVVQLCSLVADYMKLPIMDKKKLCYAAYLHDLGKVNIPKEVLISEKKLSADEWEQLKHHPDDGAAIISEVEGLEEIVPLVRQHHERYDGTGYPNNLKGTEIDYLSRILVLSDSFDAATNIRPYKQALTYSQAFDEINKCSGTQFDPEISRVFVEAIKAYCGEYIYMA